ncbi:MAG: hypothetical protein GY842_09585 [bacterium]|nr:hypothetical protein [bacterium]
MRWDRRRGVLLAGLWAITTGGCGDGLRTGGGWFTPEGEPWTIRCLTLGGPDRQRTADSVAETLRSTPSIDPDKVSVEHGAEESAVYFGTYYRLIGAETHRLEFTKAMHRDMLALKALGVPGQGHYFAEAKFVPVPTPNVGDPALSLDWNKGVYSLRVAVFANEPGFYERKRAAAAYAAELRKMGYRAFYRHGAIHSEVFVGEFGEDAAETVVGQTAPTGYAGGHTLLGMELYSREVRALQRKEDFAYERWNMHRRSETISGRKAYTASKVIRIRDEAGEEAW